MDLTVRAYELMAQQCPYPLHLGVTEAGTARMGLVKSAIGIGSLLQRGIGDTIRVSLTADPVEEVAAGEDILRALELKGGVKFVSCPTCGRTRIDLIGLAHQVEDALQGCQKAHHRGGDGLCGQRPRRGPGGRFGRGRRRGRGAAL